MLVMQCSRVGYRGICHASLVFSVQENTSDKCLNLWKTYGNFGKSSEIFVNFRKLRKRFKPVFEELKRFMKLLENFGNSSKVFSRSSNDFKIFGKSSEIFGIEVLGNLGKFSKTSETVQK